MPLLRIGENMQLLNREVRIVKSSAKTSQSLGLCNSAYGEIAVADDMPEDKQKVVFLHEIVHMISRAFALDLDEKTVCALGEGLFSCDAITIKSPHKAIDLDELAFRGTED